MNSANRQKLLQEYADQNRRPLQMKINNEAVIIPVEYTLSGSAEEIQKNFLADYFDQQKDERRKYKEAGIAPRQIEMNGAVYVVPFKLRNVERRDTQIVELVLRRAQAKYNRAVSLTRKLDRIYPERKYTVEVAGEHVKRMQAAYNRYLVGKFKAQGKAALFKAGEMLAGGFRSLSQSVRSPFDLASLERCGRKIAMGSLLTLGIGLSSYGLYHSVRDKPADKEKAALGTNRQAVPEGDAADFAEVWEQQAQAVQGGQSESKSSGRVSAAEAPGFKRSEAQKDKLFKRYMKDIFESEGGYADETIDQPTNMGIIQPTLDSYRKRFPKEAARLKFPQKVKELKRSQAMQISHRLYFDQYKIGDYRNESIGQLVFDIYVNHTPQTAKEFIDQALKAARKTGAKIALPRSTTERVAVVNALAEQPAAEAAFYNQIMTERRFHMYKQTTLKVKRGEVKESRFAQGLRNRANKYNDRYVATNVQERGSSARLRLAMNER